MSMLSQVTKGKIDRPFLILVYGIGGIGKSTWASNAPAPIFLGSEEGTDRIDTARVPNISTYEHVIATIDELINDAHNYKTLVVDTLDWLEPLIFNKICRKYDKASIELAAGGYGKGYIEALDEWISLLKKFTLLRDKRKMNVILLAHPETVSVTDPQTQVTSQRYELKLHKRAKQKVMEYVDAMFFASYAKFRKTDGEKITAVATTTRTLYTNWELGFDAKNRYGLLDAIPMSLSWKEFVSMCGMKIDMPSLAEIRFNISNLLPLVKDDVTRSKVEEAITKAGDEIATLASYLDRLRIITSN